MTLPTPVTPIATSMPRISMTLVDRTTIGEQVASQSANYELILWDQNNRPYPYDHDSGNAVPHLTQAEIDWLMAFMTSLRARAEAAVLVT